MAVGFFVVELEQWFDIRPGGEPYAIAENAFDFVAPAPVTDRVPVCGPVDERVGRWGRGGRGWAGQSGACAWGRGV